MDPFVGAYWKRMLLALQFLYACVMYAGRAFEFLLPQLRYVLPREAFFDTPKEHSTCHSLSHCRSKIVWQTAWGQSISDLWFVLALPYWQNTQQESLEGDPVVNAPFIDALDLFYLHRLRTVLHNTSSAREGWRYPLCEVKSKVSAGDAVILVQKLQILKCFGYLTIQLKMAIVQLGIISSSRTGDLLRCRVFYPKAQQSGKHREFPTRCPAGFPSQIFLLSNTTQFAFSTFVSQLLPPRTQCLWGSRQDSSWFDCNAKY